MLFAATRKAKKDAAAQSLQEEAALQEPDVSIDLAELETESGEAVPEEDDEFTINVPLPKSISSRNRFATLPEGFALPSKLSWMVGEFHGQASSLSVDGLCAVQAKVLQRTWRGHRGRSYIRWRWGWDHRIWENENLKVVSKVRTSAR